ncbi:MAG TPA: methionine--tRNA ligase [Candidatus Paceibacterota bacterium]|nr:methionine--tRNA ligase [Candidatus Paceibacterota bacterium]
MNKKTFLISTAIDYPTERGHLGHALEKVQADVLARYKRLQGFDVHFRTGVDEHGLKIQRYAQKSEKRPQEFVDEMSGYFKDLWKALNISNDDFIRTTEERHIKVVREILKKIYEKGDIYKGKYKGLYCVDCESYYLPKDLENGYCPIHHKPIETIEEETYFFRINKYQKLLIKHIKENKNFIIPEGKKNEILNRLKEPLQDLSITRKMVGWGIPFYFDKELTLFVWIDALLNYLTTIDYPGDKFKKFWPGINIIGKDIVWHHVVIFSCLLFSLGLKLSKTIFVHGFITSNGQKMSKSIGNVVDPFELVTRYSADAVRYFLLREIPPTEDGDFTYEKFEQRYNSDLASGIGNLVARVIKIAQNINLSVSNKLSDKSFQKIIDKTEKGYKKALDEFKFNEVLAVIWELISFCDKYIEKERPWEQSDNQKAALNNLLFTINEIAVLLKPFLPETSEKIFEQLKDKKSIPLFPRV